MDGSAALVLILALRTVTVSRHREAALDPDASNTSGESLRLLTHNKKGSDDCRFSENF